ncbi:MAG: glycosyltransferase family 39 protein [Spirochaetales bacterium]|nr:glycosyltransferase family 39 protein [Spirochaetales bacterium]
MKNSLLIVIMVSFLSSCSGEIQDAQASHTLIKNPSFEKVHSGWASDWHKRSLYESGADVEYTLVTGDAHSGNQAIQIENKVPNDCRVYQYISVLPETVYKLSGWIKAENIAGDVGANICVLDSGTHTNELRDTRGKWVNVTLYGITAPYQTQMPVSCRIGMWGGGTTGKALFDDISLEIVRSKPPASAHIESFAFNYANDRQRIERYFEKAGDEKYTSKQLHISLFLAILIFISALCFFLYTLLVKGRIHNLDSIVHSVFTRWYIPAIGLFLFIFFTVYMFRWGLITAFDVQASMILFFITACGILVYLYRYKKLTTDNLIKIIIFLGISLRICYFLYSPYTDPYFDRQHDIWGAWSHTDYIKYIADNLNPLLPVGTHEAYHPPVHYFLSAIVFKLARLCNLEEMYAYRAVQVYLVFLSSLILIFTYKIFNLLECDKKVTLFGMAFVCFLPSLIYMSVYLNNDCTVAFFYCISFYFLVKVVKTKSVKHTVFLAIFTALAMLSKKSAIILFPFCGIVFLVELFKNRKNYKLYIKLGIIFLLIALPLGMSYQIRNYILFQQDLSYSVPVTGPVMPSNPYHLFYVSIDKLLEQPFPPPDGADRVFIFMELIRTSLFSAFEFRLPLWGFKDVATALMFFYLFNLVLLFLYLILSKKEDYKGNMHIMLVNFLLSIVFYIQMHFSSPYHTTHAFRYLAPFIPVSFGYFIGQANLKFSKVKFPVLRFIIKAQFVLFCLSSAMLIFLAGFQH